MRNKLMTPQSAFVTFKHPFAAYLSKKMKKIIQKNKVADAPKIFERKLKINKLW